MAKRKPLKYRDSMLDDLLPHVEKLYKQIGSYSGVAAEAEVSATCIALWLKGITRHPRADTLSLVAAACGLEYRLVRIGSNTGEPVEQEERIVHISEARRRHGRKR